MKGPPEVSRRRFLGGVGLAGTGAAVGAGASGLWSGATPPAADRVEFYGARQAGITTPAQDRLAFAAFDVTTTEVAELSAMLEVWTAAAAALTAGRAVPGSSTDPAAPPADTGEAVGLGPARLTLTLGFGPSLFDDRFGLAGSRPAALDDLPALPGDQLDPLRSDGDLVVQACADDPQVAFHAIRNLARLGRGTVTMRWSQLGFGRTASTSPEQTTPRNLMGFKDGTRNVRSDDDAALAREVWVGAEGDQAWMRGGTYLVARRIRMSIESWDRDFLADQERVIGRRKASGAPLSGSAESDLPDLDAAGPDGAPLIDARAHIRLAGPDLNDGARLLRRGYSFTDGTDPATGQLDAGLLFLCFQQDPRRQFVPIQRRLAGDLLTEYLKHTGSGVYACPPGVSPGGSWGAGLLGPLPGGRPAPA